MNKGRRTERPRRIEAWTVAGIGLVIGVAGIGLGMPTRASAPPDLSRLVFLTDDLAMPAPGCDAISILTPDGTAPDVRLEQHISPGRLSLAPEGDVVIAASTNSLPLRLALLLPAEEWSGGFLYVARWDGGAWWSDRPVFDRELAQMSAAALIEGGRVLAGTSGYSLVRMVDSSIPIFTSEPPFGIGAFRLATVGDHELTDSVGSLTWDTRRDLPGIPAAILPSPTGRFAHVVTVDADGGIRLHTLDIDTLADVAAPIELAPATELAERISDTLPEPPWDRSKIDPISRFMIDSLDQGQGTVSATRSRDGRWLVTSRGQDHSLNVVDLEAGLAMVAELPSGFERAGGVAFDASPGGHGRLAVHALESIGVFEIGSGGRLEAVGRFDGLSTHVRHRYGTPVGAIAWSAAGGELYAAGSTAEMLNHDFVRFEVDSAGRPHRIGSLDSCVEVDDMYHVSGIPNDVLTSNAWLGQGQSSGPDPTVPTDPLRIYLPLLRRD